MHISLTLCFATNVKLADLQNKTQNSKLIPIQKKIHSLDHHITIIKRPRETSTGEVVTPPSSSSHPPVLDIPIIRAHFHPPPHVVICSSLPSSPALHPRSPALSACRNRTRYSHVALAIPAHLWSAHARMRACYARMPHPPFTPRQRSSACCAHQLRSKCRACHLCPPAHHTSWPPLSI